MRDYQMISPSLEGVLNHESLFYEGIKRPIELLRILDGPASKSATIPTKTSVMSEEELKVLREYFHDLYGIFMKRLSAFLIDSETSGDESVKLLAMLQEMIRIKKWID